MCSFSNDYYHISAMPKCLLSSRYKIEFLKKYSEMSGSFAKAVKSSKISDPLTLQPNLRRKKRDSGEFGPKSYQSAMLQSQHWLQCDLVPFTTRYELEIRHNIQLMTRYGDGTFDDENEETVLFESSLENEDHEMKIEYFDVKPRKIDFGVLEDPTMSLNNRGDNIGLNEENDDKHNNLVKKKRSKALTDENKDRQRLACDVCKEVFEKRWALNSHILLHSGVKPFQCSYKTCTKQYADRSNLRAHQRSKKHHTWKIFCRQCTKPFREQRYLNLHSLSACRKYLVSINKKT